MKSLYSYTCNTKIKQRNVYLPLFPSVLHGVPILTELPPAFSLVLSRYFVLWKYWIEINNVLNIFFLEYIIFFCKILKYMDMNCFSQYKIFHTFWLVKYVYYSPIHGCVYTCIICNLRLDNQIFKLLYFFFEIRMTKRGFSCMQLPPDGYYLHYLICKLWVQKEQNEHD